MKHLIDNVAFKHSTFIGRIEFCPKRFIGITMGTNCAPLVADLFLFCYERDFMLTLSDNNQTDIIESLF